MTRSWQIRVAPLRKLGAFDTLQQRTAFVPGCGALGSTVLQVLARSGVGRIILADIDHYGVENIPAQLLCDRSVLGRPKAEVARERLLMINPDIEVEVYGAEWMEPGLVESIMQRADVAIAGPDSLAACIHLYREARAWRVPVVDFYYSPAVSVFVTNPGDPTPEERLAYPTRGQPWERARDFRIARESIRRLSAFSLSNCPWLWDVVPERTLHDFLNLEYVPTLPSLMMAAGSLVAEEAIRILMGEPGGCDYRGWFFDWRTTRVTRPTDPPANDQFGPWLTRLTEFSDGPRP